MAKKIRRTSTRISHTAWRALVRRCAKGHDVEVTFSGDIDIDCALFPKGCVIYAEWDGVEGYVTDHHDVPCLGK